MSLSRRHEKLLQPFNEGPFLRLQAAPVHECLKFTGIQNIIALNILATTKLPISVGVTTPTTLDLPALVSLGFVLAVAARVLPGGLHTHTFWVLEDEMKSNTQEITRNDDEYEKGMVTVLLFEVVGDSIFLFKCCLVLFKILLLSSQKGKSISLLSQKRLCAHQLKIKPNMEIVTIVAALIIHPRLFV